MNKIYFKTFLTITIFLSFTPSILSEELDPVRLVANTMLEGLSEANISKLLIEGGPFDKALNLEHDFKSIKILETALLEIYSISAKLSQTHKTKLAKLYASILILLENHEKENLSLKLKLKNYLGESTVDLNRLIDKLYLDLKTKNWLINSNDLSLIDSLVRYCRKSQKPLDLRSDNLFFINMMSALSDFALYSPDFFKKHKVIDLNAPGFSFIPESINDVRLRTQGARTRIR